MNNYYVQYLIETTKGTFYNIDSFWAKNEIEAIISCIEFRFPNNSSCNISDFKIVLCKVY